MWIATFILPPISVYLTYKATNDSNLFNAEWYLAHTRRIRGFLNGYSRENGVCSRRTGNRTKPKIKNTKSKYHVTRTKTTKRFSAVWTKRRRYPRGKVVIVVDDEDRENEGDFIVAGEKITPEIVNFMLHNGRGVLCAC